MDMYFFRGDRQFSSIILLTLLFELTNGGILNSNIIYSYIIINVFWVFQKQHTKYHIYWYNDTLFKF